MDKRLIEEAIRGSEETLQTLMGANPLILDQAMIDRTGMENLLDLAALYGNSSLAREILLRCKEFTRAFNSQGQSPLHVASARGHVGVVKEILSADADACFVRDRDGRIPLHVAAIKGQVEVLKELFDTDEITAFLLTDTGEPILHLCANNYQFKALKKLVYLVKDENFVNLKDSEGNTVLHRLASKGGNSEVVNFLLQRTKVDVNAVNNDGSTPMDLSLESEAVVVNCKTDWYLICAGAKTTGSIGKKAGRKQSVNQGSWSYETQLVVAVLAITVAFQAGISPPGGVWQDTGYHNNTLPNNAHESSPSKLVQHYVGRSVMLYVDPTRYKYFHNVNVLTLLFSTTVIVLLFFRRTCNNWFLDFAPSFLTFYSIITMVLTAHISMSFVSSEKTYITLNSVGIEILAKLLFLLLLLQHLLLRGIGSRVVLYVHCLRITRFLKRWVSGRCCTTPVESREVGRP